MHMHYKGTGKVHSFKGQVENGGTAENEWQSKIRIQGPTGSIAYRITKFQIMDAAPGAAGTDLVVKIYRELQSTATGTVDFGDAELLAAAWMSASSTVGTVGPQVIIFDNTLFVRNIYITGYDVTAAGTANYYIELEEVKVSAAGMAQLAVAAARRTQN